MKKSVFKSFACESRRELIEKVRIQARQQGVSEDNKFIENMAYDWFNRFVLLRFMEVNNYLPEEAEPMSSYLSGNVKSGFTRNAFKAGFPVDDQKIYDMEESKNDVERLFKYMIIALWDNLNETFPCIFKKLEYSDKLLFPERILDEGAFISKLTSEDIISESCWRNVTIVGWLYEYYMCEEKNRMTKSKKKYTKEEIPFVTQLFTPDWIVKYMVENSLGRYWVEAHPEHSDLKVNWKFYIENSRDESYEKLQYHINKGLKVEDIKCFDPACGSGHILIYMFDVLYQIYERCGYRESEIPELIVKNNLYGMDIDDRAYQLTCFALAMQGMKHDRDFLRKMNRGWRETAEFNIAAIEESNGLSHKDIAYIAGENSGENYNRTKEFIEGFTNAKIYGSLIQLQDFHENFFVDRLKHIILDKAENPVEEQMKKKVVRLLPQLIKQAHIMGETYDVLVTNPPYMGGRYFIPQLRKYISRNYSKAKADMFSAFMLYGFSKVKCNGHLGFMVPFVWMFIQSYEELRKIIIDTKNISSLIQLEYSGFEEATVPVCTFTLRNYNVDMPGEYIKLSDFKGAKNQPEKTREAIDNSHLDYVFTVNQKKMKRIPGNRFGYWLTDREIYILNRAKVMADVAYPCTGMQTGNNDEYVRQWFEVDYNSIDFYGENKIDKYWIPYQMGGQAKKWYGNISEIIYWKDNGQKVRKEKGSVIRNEKFFSHKGISWKRITSGKNTIRVLNEGFIFDQSADSIFVKDEADYNYILSFFNTKIMASIFEFISPTLNLTAGTVKQIPVYMEQDPYIRKKIDLLCRECIAISKNDWDSFEISWDFKVHPLLTYKGNSNTIEEAYCKWKNFSERQFYRMKRIEEELNELFIKIYGFEHEITAEVEEKDITIERADSERDIKSFISYAVGCMFGRYSLDTEGIAYAGGSFNSWFTINNSQSGDKIWKVRKVDKDDERNVISDLWTDASFVPDEDNIIPVLYEDYFENDIVSRFVEFVGIAFGKKNLSRNIAFIAWILKKKRNESDRDTLRRYFINDFFKDHLQRYKKKPIYWLFTSGKYKVFNCLSYVHRFDKNVLSKIRTDYVCGLQGKLYKKKNALCLEKGDTAKKLSILHKQMDELKEYDKKLHHMEKMQVKIHLDSGIRANYEKFKLILK